MERIAQTNIQLYNDMIDRGMSEFDLALVRKCYDFLGTLCSGYLQGDGKPFICHSVGVAGIVVKCDLPADIVAIGLLHSCYLNGDFGDGLHMPTARRRKIVLDAVGPHIASLIDRFNDVRRRMHDIDGFVENLASLDTTDRHLALVEVADALEKHVDAGIFYFGDASWLHDERRTRGDRMIAIAGQLGHPWLAQALHNAFERADAPSRVPASMRYKDRKYLELVVPMSCRRRRWPLLKLRLSEQLRDFRSARPIAGRIREVVRGKFRRIGRPHRAGGPSIG